MSSTKFPAFLEGKNVYLTPHNLVFTDDFVRWMNDEDVRIYTATCYPVAHSYEEAWIRSYTEKNDEHKVSLVIIVRDASGDDKPIGVIALSRINYIDGTATTGTIIGPKEFWGQGYGTEAKMLLLRYAFLTLNLRKISSQVIAYNTRSVAYARKCGYVEDGGPMKAHVFKNGAYHDMVQLAVFREAWIPLWEAYKAKYGLE